MLERLLVILRERREYFLSQKVAFESSGLELLVEIWSNLGTETCDTGERFRVQWWCHCQVVWGKKRYVGRVLDPCVGHNLKTRNASLKSCDG